MPFNRQVGAYGARMARMPRLAPPPTLPPQATRTGRRGRGACWRPGSRLRRLRALGLPRRHQGLQGYHARGACPPRGLPRFQGLHRGLDGEGGLCPKGWWQGGLCVQGGRGRHQQS